MQISTSGIELFLIIKTLSELGQRFLLVSERS